MKCSLRRFLSAFLSILLLFSLCAALTLPAAAQDNLPELKLDEPVSITLLLENDAVRMSVLLYRVAEYRDGLFVFLPTWNELELTPYAKMERASQRNEATDLLRDYIQENQLPPDAVVLSENGKIVFEELTAGVYLILDDRSFEGTGKLSRPVLIEAPQPDPLVNDYMYDVTIAPKWEKIAWFTFRPEVVDLMTTLIILCLSLVFCLIGFRAVSAVLIGAVALICGLVGVSVSRGFTAEFLYHMLFFDLFAVTGAGLVLVLCLGLSPIVKKLGISRLLYKNSFWITPILGSAAFAFCLMTRLWYAPLWNGLIFLLLAAVGMVLQYRRRQYEHPQYTYLDLIRLPLPAQEGNAHD